MIEGLTWEGLTMVIVISALAAGSITETVKKAIQQGIIERTGDKPWWRGTILRVVSVVSGAAFGWLMLPEMPTMGNWQRLRDHRGSRTGSEDAA